MIGVFTAVTGFLGSRLGKIVAAVGTAFAFLAAAYVAGGRNERKDHQLEALEQFKETKEKIDAVQPSVDRDAAIERLRANSRVR